MYPLGGNLIKSNFHLFKKKCAPEREEHLAPSSLRHPWGVSRPQGRGSGSIPKLVAPLSIPLRPVGLLPPLLHDSLQEMSSPLQADAITSAFLESIRRNSSSDVILKINLKIALARWYSLAHGRFDLNSILLNM